jgi:hypothetical protein
MIGARDGCRFRHAFATEQTHVAWFAIQPDRDNRDYAAFRKIDVFDGASRRLQLQLHSSGMRKV